MTLMNDIYIAGLVDNIESELKAFIFFWNMGDHVMYRQRAEEILEYAKQLHNETYQEEDE